MRPASGRGRRERRAHVSSNKLEINLSQGQSPNASLEFQLQQTKSTNWITWQGEGTSANSLVCRSGLVVVATPGGSSETHGHLVAPGLQR